MARKISIEVDLGQRGVEKTDVAVFLDEKLIENYWDYSYNDLPNLAKELKTKYPDAELQTYCLGEDCAGKSHRWEIEI